MHRAYGFALAVAAVVVMPQVGSAQAMDASRNVAGGGVFVKDWTGKIDANEEKAGATLASAKFSTEGNGIRITTGPATTYWNTAGKASGNYTIMATFTEPKFQNLNTHPHPYGIMIGGNDLGTANQSYLYCAAYGNGNFIVRGFGPEAFQLNGRRGEANAAVNKAAAIGEPVKQDISVSVKGDKVDCSINGKVVWSADKSAVVTAGKLKSTDGTYGIRAAHNTDVIVTNFMKM